MKYDFQKTLQYENGEKPDEKWKIKHLYPHFLMTSFEQKKIFEVKTVVEQLNEILLKHFAGKHTFFCK